MQIGTITSYEKQNSSKIYGYRHRVVWIDAKNHAVFSLNKFLPAGKNADQLPTELPAFAREIIDMNSAKE